MDLLTLSWRGVGGRACGYGVVVLAAQELIKARANESQGVLR